MFSTGTTAMRYTVNSSSGGITQVQKKTAFTTTNGTSHTITLDSTPTNGNLIIFCITHDGTLNVAPAGYTEAVSGSDFLWGRIYYKIAGAAESATITLTTTINEPSAMMALEYSGITATPLDQTVAANAVGTGTTIISGTTPATTVASELVIVTANMRMDVGGQTVTAWTNSFVSQGEAKSTGASDVNMLLNVAAKIVSATGTQQSTGTITTGGLGHDTALVATFKGA